MTSEAQDQWLIRTATNTISGPYSLQNIRDIIQQGKLELNDEVCHANAYWFYIHEIQEVRNQLGMEVPRILYSRKIDEGTQTQTDATDLERTDPEIGATRMAPRVPARSSGPSGRDAESFPELSQPLDEVGENTAVMSNRAFRDFRKKKKKQEEAAAETPPDHSVIVSVTPDIGPVEHRVERPKLFYIFAYLMMMGAVMVLLVVLKLLHEHPH